MEKADIDSQHDSSGRGSLERGIDMNVLGVFTGSALEELSCALVRYHQDTPQSPLRVNVLHHGRVPIPSSSHQSLLTLFHETSRQFPAISEFNAQLGQVFSSGITLFCEDNNITPHSIDLIGTHSHSVASRRGSTDWSVSHPFGWNETIKAETGGTVIFNFSVIERPTRPVYPVAFVEKLLLQHPQKFRVCLDISELVNLTFAPCMADESLQRTISYYCGPGSLLIDYAVRYCSSNTHREDNRGRIAARGRVNQDIVEKFLSSRDYLLNPPSLTIAREMFGDHEAQQVVDECLLANLSEVDIIATITRITAANIVFQYRRILAHHFPSDQQVDELFICGTSARNLNIIDFLVANLPETVSKKSLDDIGIPRETAEAVCYAHLALETALAQATRETPPTATPLVDPRDARIHGTILHGKNWDDLSVRIQNFSEGKQLHATKDVQCDGDLEIAIDRLGLH